MRTRTGLVPCLCCVCAALLVSLVLPGCASRREQLERVAKDWCETIRASQVIPVYPPTADLLPGDMFLVDRPVREQQSEWDEKGFLALPFELPRMAQSDLPDLNDRYGTSRWAMFAEDGVDPDIDKDETPEGPGDETDGPGDEPDDPGDQPEDDDPEPDPEDPSPEDESTPGLRRGAPTAAFPTYSFSVSNGGSFDLAMPVQGVPVGLSAAGGNGANGTIALKDVRTFGYDNFELLSSVRRFWRAPDHRTYLAELHAQSRGVQPYLRVVGRVYGVKSFNVTLNSRSSFGFGADAGSMAGTERGDGAAEERGGTVSTEDAARFSETSVGNADSAPTPNATPNQGEADRAALVDRLNRSLSSSDATKLGVSARFVAASSRSVSLVETFTEPLVVGYVGFDLPISEDGSLGAPVLTYDVLERGAAPNVRWRGTITAWHDRMNTLLGLLESDAMDEGALDAALEAAAASLGHAAGEAYAAARADRKSPADAFDTAVMQIQKRYPASSAASEQVYRNAVEAIEGVLPDDE